MCKHDWHKFKEIVDSVQRVVFEPDTTVRISSRNLMGLNTRGQRGIVQSRQGDIHQVVLGPVPRCGFEGGVYQLMGHDLDVTSLGLEDKDAWAPDSETDCQMCNTHFSVTNRRHHCRHCGKIICGNCVKNILVNRHTHEMRKVCKDCEFTWMQCHAQRFSLDLSDGRKSGGDSKNGDGPVGYKCSSSSSSFSSSSS